MQSSHQNLSRPGTGEALSSGVPAQAKFFVNLATSPKHPYWCLLGTLVEPAQSAEVDSYSIAVAKPLEPQLLKLLHNCRQAKLSVYVKLDDGRQPRYRQLLVEVNPDATRATAKHGAGN